LEKQEFSVGESVRISIVSQDLSTSVLKIYSPRKEYSFFTPKKNIVFIPKEPGHHRIVLYVGDEEVASSEFDVLGDEEPCSVSLQRTSYALGEVVTFILKNSKNCILEVTGAGETQAVDAKDPVFYPDRPGEYIAALREGSEVRGEISFVVEDKVAKVPDEIEEVQESMEYETEPSYLELGDKPIKLKDGNDKELDYKVFREDKSRLRTQALSELNQKYILKIEDSKIKQIDFKTSDIVAGSEIRIEELQDQIVEDNEAVSAYAIDPTGFLLGNSTVTVTAKGTQLWKCKDWDFEKQYCFGSWEKTLDITPGMNYTFSLSSQDPGFAEIGVASVNSDKSIYLPGEEVNLVAVVLNRFGFIVKEADVTLDIRKPDGNSMILSTQNGLLKKTDEGLYEAYFRDASLEGNYDLTVTAFGVDVNSTLRTSFDVSIDHPFDILRKSSSVIDPWKKGITTEIKVVSRIDTANFSLTEILPGSFQPQDYGSAYITKEDGKIKLTWNDLNNGSVVGYKATVPKISPELYDLSSSISYPGGTFAESRPWYVAIDPRGVTGYMVYKDTTNANVIKYRVWNTTTNSIGAERSGPNVGSPPAWTRFVCMQAYPDCIWMGMEFDNTLDMTVYHEDTDTWDGVTNLGTVDDDYMPFDVACEDVSGECIIVYETSAAGNNQFDYRNYSVSGTLSNAGTVAITAATNNAFRWIKLYPQHGTDRIGAVFQNLQAGGGEIETAIWDGYSFTNWQEIYNDQADLTRKTFDCAWEGSTGDFTCFYARDTLNGVYGYKWNRSISTWEDLGEVWAAADIGNEPANMVACGEDTQTGNLNHNSIMLMVQDAGSDLQGTIWNGTAFRTTIDPIADTGGVEWVRDDTMTCSWEHDGDTAVMAWMDANSLTPEWGTFTLSTMSFSFATYTTGSTTGSTTWADDVEQLEMSLSPETDDMLLTGISLTNGIAVAAEVECTRWTGSTFDATGCGNIETTGSLDASGSREFFGFAAAEWSRYNPPPNVTILTIPLNNSNQTSLPLTFFFNVTDNSGVGNCTVYINSSGWDQAASKTTIVNKKQNNISVSTLADGRYKWNVLCFDNSNPAKSDWYTYNFTFRLDTKAPEVSNLSTYPSSNLINTNVNIFAYILDATRVDKVKARVSLPNSTVYTLTMADVDGNNVYNVTFTEAGVLGTYNVTIYANDTFGFLNSTVKKNFTVALEALSLSTDRDNYVENQGVKIYAKGFNPLRNVTLRLYDPTGDPVSGYPKNITSNLTGGINDTWTIPLSSFLGAYIINATEITDISRSAAGSFEVVSALLETNKTSFEQGQQVFITGEFFDPSVNVTINITDPLGIEVFGQVNVSTSITGTFNMSWNSSYDSDVGTYVLRGFEPSDTVKAGSYTFSITLRTIVLSTDYPWYKEGEQVTILGNRFSPFSNITINVFDSLGASVSGYPKNITSNLTGGINDSLVVVFVAGNYTVNATDTRYRNLNKNISFEVNIPQVYTDSLQYNDDDPVLIRGKFWDRGVIITLNLTNSTGRNESGFPTSLITNSTGGFSYLTYARAVGIDAVYYNITAYDSSNPVDNATARYGVFRRAELAADSPIYVQGQDVFINGSSYTASGNVTLWVKYSNGGTALTYPRAIMIDASGNFNHTFDLLDYCPGTYTVIGTDITNPLLNASDTFIVRDWWNTSWEKRRQIKVTNTGSTQSGIPVLLNVTGLAGNISNCYELRVISTLSGEDVPYNIYFGDDSDWCEIEFLANVSDVVTNESLYYVYYNNSGAVNENYQDIGQEVELFYDNFFDANIIGWTQDPQNDWAWDSERSYDPGGGAMLIDGAATNAHINSTEIFNLDPAIYRSVNFSAKAFIEAAWDAGESIRLQFYNGAWVQQDSIDGAAGTGAEENNWRTISVPLAGAYYVSSFRFRFISTVSDTTEDGHVDVVNLTARYKGTSGVSARVGAVEEQFTCELMDATRPGIMINSHQDYYNTTDSTPQIYFTTTDNHDMLTNFSIFVDYIKNGQKGNSSNNTLRYFNISALSQGQHVITVEAKDDYSNTRNASVILLVDFSGPLLNLTQPRNFTNTSSSSYDIIASVYDVYSQVNTVTMLYRKNYSLSWTQLCEDTISPYQCAWDTSVLAEGNSYQVRSYANDSLGNIGLNYTVTNITIDRTGPLVNITSPQNFTNISATSYQVSSSAYDRYSDISKVLFYYKTSGSWVFACSDASSPYGCTWNLAAISDRKNIQLRAYANDSLGNMGFNYTVYNLTKDTTAPSLVNMTLSPAVQTLGRSVHLSVNVSDLIGTREVEARITKPGYASELFYFTKNGDYYNLTYWNTSVVGIYNMSITLNDTLGNAVIHNYNFTVSYESLLLSVNRYNYVTTEIVHYYGKGFGVYKNITVNIFNSTGVSVAGYPRNVTSNLTGGFNYSWAIPFAQSIGIYLINATDSSDETRSILTQFEIVTAIVETVDSSYAQAEKVQIIGSYWDNDADVTINLTDPYGNMLYGPINITSNNSGFINLSWQSDYNSTLGSYLLSAYQPSSPGKRDSHSFNITVRPRDIATEFSWYKLQDNLLLSGKGFSPLTNVTLRLFNSSGTIIAGFPLNVSSNSIGGMNFTYLISLPRGNYTFNATDTRYRNLANTTTFEVQTPVIYTDAQVYINGETVTVFGRYWDRLTNVTVDIKNQTGGSLVGYPKNLSSDSDGQVQDTLIAEAIGVGLTYFNITSFNPYDSFENSSASYAVQRVALLSIPKTIYDQNEVVNITGNYFAQLGIVKMLIWSDGGAPYYPKYEIGDMNGDINHLYSTNYLCEGEYIIHGYDQTYSSLYANVSFNITHLNDNSSTKSVSESSPSGTYTLFSGPNSYTYASDNARQYLGAADIASNFAAHLNYTFNLTSLNTTEDLMKNLSFR
jgi:hypothetical protein